MFLSQFQQRKFWNLWQQTCRVQGWTRDAGFSTAEIDAARKRILALAGFSSLTLVDPLDGFDRVLEQLAILRSDITAVARASGMHRTRLCYAIRALADEPYWQRICEDRFKTTDLDQLSKDQLLQLLITLKNRSRKSLADLNKVGRGILTAPVLETADNVPF